MNMVKNLDVKSLLSVDALSLLAIYEKMSGQESSIEVVKEFNASPDCSFYFEDSIWEKIEKDDGIEIWTPQFGYLFSHGGLRAVSSYSLVDLLTTPWRDLFDRNEIHAKQIERAVVKVIQTSAVVENICPPHVVSEKQPGHTVTALVHLKMLAPVFSKESHLLVGCLAVTSIKRLS
jgi:hypothetical protein